MTAPTQETQAVPLQTLLANDRFIKVADLGRVLTPQVYRVVRHEHISDTTRSVVIEERERGERMTLDSMTQVIAVGET